MTDTYPATPLTAECADDLAEPEPHLHLLCTFEPETLPRDNQLRGLFAAVALKAYAARTGVGGEDFSVSLSDMLGDLRHLCDALGLDFDEQLRRGTWHYTEELHGRP